MVELGTKIAAKREDTNTLNWMFRKKYILNRVIPYEQMQHIEHNAPYYFIHYLSEEYGASLSRMTESEWQDILEEPGVKNAFDQIPYSDTSTDEPYIPHEERSIELMLGQAVEQPLLPVEPATTTHIVLPDSGGAFIVETEVPAIKQDVIDMLSGVKEIAKAHDFEIVTVSSPIQDQGVPYEVKNEPKPKPGSKKIRRIAEPVEPVPPTSPAPEPVALLPLVLPEFHNLLMQAPMEDTPERRFITHPTDLRDSYIIKGSTDKYYTNSGSFPILFDALLNHHYPVSETSLFYTVGPNVVGTNALGTGSKSWQRVSTEVLLSTATAYYAGRVLGVVLTHFKNSDQPQGDLVHHWLLGSLGDMGNQMTPDSVLMAVEHESHRTNADALDRLRLPLRLLHQLVKVSQQPVGNPPADKAPDSAKDWHRLVWASRRICWHLNITTPSGYAFLKGMLTPQRLGFTRPENALLGELLTLTNKIKR